MPAFTFRVLRTEDLVDLQITAHDLEIETAHGERALVPSARGGTLVVSFPFQHLGEQASYEITQSTAEYDPKLDAVTSKPPETPSPELPPSVPIQVRAAGRSRLVFTVPSGERIPLSSRGVLDALGRLPLRVAPAAQPRKVVLSRTREGLLTVPGGALVLSDRQLAVVEGAATAMKRSMHEAAAALRTTRVLLARAAAVDLRAARTATPARVGRRLGSVFGRGGLAIDPGAIELVIDPPVRAPKDNETAIEAPWRLILSPSERAGFAHASEPQRSPRHPELVELWHTRLGVRRSPPDGPVTIDEREDPQRIVRAIWAREKEQTPEPAAHDNQPFRSSIDGLDRVILVRQSAESKHAKPAPIDARGLVLSSLGAWLDLHGEWKTRPYTKEGLPAIQSWDHLAPMGRDQFVRVVYPGFLFPFGHRAALVKITERKIKDATSPQARLYQRKFLVIGEPERLFQDRKLPFLRVMVRPLVTPDLRDPISDGAAGGAVVGQDLFWPTLMTGRFEFTLDAIDHEGRTVRLRTPLLWVADHLLPDTGAGDTNRQKIRTAWAASPPIAASGQRVAFAPAERGGETTLETHSLRFDGALPRGAGEPRSQPELTRATVVIPAMRRLAVEAGPVDIEYAAPYLASGFAADAGSPQVWASLTSPSQLSFSGSTDKSGGFLQPDLPIAGLSRRLGLASSADGAGPQFGPGAFTSVLPKLFGLIELKDLLDGIGLDEAPRFVQDLLDQVTGFIADVERLVQLAEQAAGALATPGSTLKARLASLQQRISDLFGASDESVLEAARAQLSALLGDIRTAATSIQSSPAVDSLPPVLRERVRTTCTTVLARIADAGAFIEQIFSFVQGLLPRDGEARARFEWRPKIKSWPASNPPLFRANDPRGLVLAVEARTGGAGSPQAQVLAELRDFDLVLLPAALVANAELLCLKFERISFRSGTGRRTEVDVVFKQKEFLGVLGYLAKLSEWIPLDGFSDPPYFDVSAEGIRAGFSLALPSIAVGVFSLENMSFSADVHVPFIGARSRSVSPSAAASGPSC